MATIGGPNTEKDGLVFGYDTGYGVADNTTATRFYPGETTENLIYDMGGTVTSAYPEVVYRSTATETNVIDTSAPGGKYSRFTGIDGSSNNQLYSRFSSYSIDVRGDSVNYSVYLKGSGTCHLTIYDNSSGYGTSPTITLTSDWVRYNYTRTISASATSYWVAVRGVLNTTDVYIAGQQAKRGTHATPYVENNRSSTQSVIDLKRTTDIDVSNVSFDSTGQPTFDGSNDQIVVEVDDIVRNTNNITIEGIVNATSISSAGPWAVLTDHASAADKDGFWWHYNIGNSVYFRVEDATAGEQGTTFSGTVPFVANTYEHVVTVVGDNNVKIYVNGVLSKSYTPNFKWNRIDSSKTAYLHIGRTYPNYYLSCAIPVFKMHNKELTVDEIKQNFNAYKNRFDI